MNYTIMHAVTTTSVSIVALTYLVRAFLFSEKLMSEVPFLSVEPLKERQSKLVGLQKEAKVFTIFAISLVAIWALGVQFGNAYL